MLYYSKQTMQERLLVGGMLSGWPFFNEPKPKNLTRSGKTKKRVRELDRESRPKIWESEAHLY